MEIVKIAMIGIGGVLLAIFLKQQKSEYALYVSLAAAVLILVFCVNRLQIAMEAIGRIESYLRLDGKLVAILIKMIGITYVAEFAANICRDAGFGAVGSQIEMFGKFSIMAVSVPVLLSLIETIEGFIGS